MQIIATVNEHKMCENHRREVWLVLKVFFFHIEFISKDLARPDLARLKQEFFDSPSHMIFCPHPPI